VEMADTHSRRVGDAS